MNIDTAYHNSSAGSKRGGQPLTGFKGPQVEAMRKLKRKPSLLMDQVWYHWIRKVGGNNIISFGHGWFWIIYIFISGIRRRVKLCTTGNWMF